MPAVSGARKSLAVRRIRSPRPVAAPSPSPRAQQTAETPSLGTILGLQRTIGNQAVSRLLPPPQAARPPALFNSLTAPKLSSPGTMLALQRAIGNRAASSLLQQHSPAGGATLHRSALAE